LAALMACLFVSAYNLISHDPRRSLPAITASVVALTPYAYLVPIILFFVGVALLRSRTERPVAFEALIASAWLLAFCWVLAALFAWQLTHVEIVDAASHR
jgi:hypothetical protein